MSVYMYAQVSHVYGWGSGGGREGGSQNIKEIIGSLDSGVTKNCLIT